MEVELVRRDGAIITVLENTVGLFDNQGGLLRFHGYIFDITDRKRAEDALRENEARYRRLHDSMTDCFVQVAMSGEIVDVNRSYLEMLGYDEDELRARTHQDLTPARWHEFEQEIVEEQILPRGYSDVYEKEYIRKDGTVFPVELKVYLLRDADGKPSGMWAIARDITDRKRAEAERSRLTAAIEQTGEMIVITDSAGTIQYVNPAFEQTTGYSREEAVGQSPRILKSGKQDEAFYSNLWRTVTAGRIWNGRMVNKRKSGTLYTEEVTISPVRDASGQIVNYVAVKRDITDHLRLTTQFQQAQKMESVGRLAGGVAHDFNNMLSVILGYAELALGRVAPSEPLHDDLEQIIGAAQHSADITRQLLAFARKQTIAPQVLDLNATVEGLLKMLRRLIGEDIDLAWLPGAGLWPVRMDISQIEQVLANLCVNARDAIAGVGTVTIETGNAVLDEAYCVDHAGFVPGEFTLLAVSDDGCGMDKETLDEIFEPFFTTKEVGHGIGLGLATVYGIVKQNGGFINAYSEPDKGTTFKIYLPRHESMAVDIRKPSTTPPPSGHGETVLIVEDEISILKLGKAMLERLGYTVLTAGTPSEAMRLADAHEGEIHLLITDVVMPGMNGRELAERLQVSSPTLKCLFMSGYTANTIAHRGVLAEGVSFVQKPFSMQELAAKIQEALQKKDTQSI